jgi:hypothetical protein
VIDTATLLFLVPAFKPEPKVLRVSNSDQYSSNKTEKTQQEKREITEAGYGISVTSVVSC